MARGGKVALIGESGSGKSTLLELLAMILMPTSSGTFRFSPHPEESYDVAEIWRARDGWISFGLRGGQARIPNLVASVEYMAECGMAPDWLLRYDWQGYDHNALSREEADRLEGAFADFFASRTRRELYEQALARRIMLAPCNDAREISEQPQLRSRGFFTTLDYPELGASLEHPAFFARSNVCRTDVRRRAPRIGEHNAEIYAELRLDPEERGRLVGRGVI